MTEPSTIVKTCRICHVIYTFATWQKLDPLGTRVDFGAFMEFRLCRCRNSLVILLDEDGEFLPEHPLDKRDS